MTDATLKKEKYRFKPKEDGKGNLTPHNDYDSSFFGGVNPNSTGYGGQSMQVRAK